MRTALLLLLAEQPMHGYQLMQAITERTSGAWQPSPGA
ncbi:MAG: PadR family transcriptional regulator, partial [Pseudonocardiaceae bacterium]